jgi:hypothetical protein
MGTQNFARGAAMFADPPYMALGGGVQTDFGLVLPPGGRVAAYVRSTGPQDLDPRPLRDQLVPTLAAGLARCRAGFNDVVYVLPGHTENVTDNTMLDNLVAGTQIVGVGRGSNKPVFIWTATAAQWILNDANVSIRGLRLRFDGANGIVKAIAVTGADCEMVGNEFVAASGAALKATIGVELAAGADRFIFDSNYVRGTATHNVTNFLLLAAVVNDVKVTRNLMIASATAANGLVNVQAACLGLYIAGNQIYNTHTSSTACINVSNAASDGIICDNYCGTLNNGTATAQGIVLGAASLVKCFQNFSGDQPILSGILTPTVVT